MAFQSLVMPCVKLNRSYEEPGAAGGDGFLEILGELSIAIEPRQRALEDPAAWQAQGILEPVASTAAIGEDVPKSGK
jgi:hypothetical protein